MLAFGSNRFSSLEVTSVTLKDTSTYSLLNILVLS